MSINQYSSEIPEALWWTQQHQSILMEPIQNHLSSTSPPPSSSQLHHHYHHPMYPITHSNISHRFNLNQNEDDEDDDDNENAQPTTTATGTAAEEEKEAMFEKPLTPSDVGKLNRLVIPKQHAEKYFPLGGDSGESKGLLLSFEDESGKCWRFRYSYWNSSQSYVLTKGWSRYVKEKRLDAGDVVLFERHRADAQRFFIGWRRRPQSGIAAAHVGNSRAAVGDSNSNNNGINMGVGWTRGFYSAHSYPTHHHQPLPYQPHCLHAGLSLLSSHSHSINPILLPFSSNYYAFHVIIFIFFFM